MKKCGHETNATGCALCVLYETNEVYRSHVDKIKSCPIHATRPVRIRLTILHPDRCQHFTGRTEFRPGCGGWKCKGGCTLGLPAVPGVACQSCDRYEPDPDYAGRGVAGWVS